MSTSGPEPIKMSVAWQVRQESLPGPTVFRRGRKCTYLGCGTVLHSYNPSANRCHAHQGLDSTPAVVVSIIPEADIPKSLIQFYPCKCGRIRRIILTGETLQQYLVRRPLCFPCTPLEYLKRKTH